MTGRALREAAGGPADLSHAALSQPVGAHQPRKFKLLDLFSGIGGFSLGLERTGGFETVAFCEIEEFPRRVLAKHWPGVPIYDDVRTLTAERLATDGIAVDAICGGFPCQDISLAGRGEGIGGTKSGLWGEYRRLISELRPAYVLVENVAALLGRGLGVVLGDLAALGYDAEWECLGAHAVGAPHIRDRVWLVAYPGGEQHKGDRIAFCGAGAGQLSRADTRIGRHWVASGKVSAGRHGPFYGDGWAVEPALDRVANGVPNRVDRLRALGNAVVPQIPELIGRAILAAHAQPLHNPSAHLSHPQHTAASGKGFVFNHNHDGYINPGAE